VANGYAPQAVIDKIHQVYGYGATITKILNRFRKADTIPEENIQI
jgi:hypothetical protein